LCYNPPILEKDLREILGNLSKGEGVDVKGQPPKATVSSQVTMDQLKQYQQAAEQTGFRITTLAREGQNYTSWSTARKLKSCGEEEKITGEKTPRTIQVSPGHVAISIKPPEGETNFAPFWKAYNALTPPPTGQKG
jgi:hypothetical protein